MNYIYFMPKLFLYLAVFLFLNEFTLVKSAESPIIHPLWEEVVLNGQIDRSLIESCVSDTSIISAENFAEIMSSNWPRDLKAIFDSKEKELNLLKYVYRLAINNGEVINNWSRPSLISFFKLMKSGFSLSRDYSVHIYSCTLAKYERNSLVSSVAEKEKDELIMKQLFESIRELNTYLFMIKKCIEYLKFKI